MIIKHKNIIYFIFLVFPFTIMGQDSLSLKKHIGYDTQEEYKISSSISSIFGEELSKTFTPNLLNSMIGKLPGLTITQGSDEAGVIDNTLRARGTGTFQGLRDPLIVIDGFVTQYKDADGYLRSLLSQLTAEEIESITLLKDASATAIYGLRGANGVLLVNTKRGLNAPLKINVNTQIGFQQPTRMPKFLNSYDYANLYNEAYCAVNNGNKFYNDDVLNAYRDGTDKYLYPDVNWYDETLRNRAEIYKVGMNFQGGNNIVKYFVLLNYLGNNGLLRKTEDLSENTKNQSYDRYNIRSNLDINISKNLSADITIGLAIEEKITPAGVDVGKNTNDFFSRIQQLPPNAFPVHNPDNTWGGNSSRSNPLANITDRGYWKHGSRNINSALKLTEKLNMLVPGLSVSGAISFNSYYLGYSNRYANYEYYSIIGKDVDQNYIYSTAYGKKEQLTIDDGISDQWRNSTIQGSVNYNNVFDLHEIDALLLYSLENETYGRQQPFIHEGLAGRLSYTYNRKYSGEFAMGIQATETFAKGKRTGFFPAGSIAWIVSEEDFLRDNDLINFMKVRLSYGLTGNDKINGDTRFMYEQEYGEKEGYNFGIANGYIPGYRQLRLANPDITWEKERKGNVGLEITLAKHFELSFDYFNNQRYDILCLPGNSIPSYIGAELPYMNVGKTKNRGFELGILYSNSVGKDFNYYAKLNAWFAKNEIIYMSESVRAENNAHLYQTGLPINQPFYLEAIGFYTQAEIDDPDVAKPTWKDVLPGDLRYKDWNSDGIIDNNDRYPFDYTDIPELTLSFTVGFEYKNFDFYSFFHTAINRTVYLNTDYYKAFQNNGSISEFALNRWTSEESANSATYPRLSLTNEQNNYRESTFWKCNGNFLKLRNVELGYTFRNVIPSDNSDLRLFINGSNLFSIDAVKGYDPERIGGYPAVRTLSLGANFSF